MRGWWRKLLGSRGERMAARYLRRQGFRILARQYKNWIGEIDLIALDGDCVVFVEVKTRSSDTAGHPVEAVTPQKQTKLTQTALVFLKHHKLLEHAARFDVVAVLWPEGKRQPQLTHYENAFSPTGFGQMFT